MLLPAAGGAQIPGGGPTPSPTPTPTPAPPPAERASPRATMTTFLKAVNAYTEGEAETLAPAVAALNLRDVPEAVREEVGPELAVKLKDVIDKVEVIRLEEVPDRTEGEPWIFLRQPEGEIAIRRQDNGEWLFSRATVESIDALFRAYEARESKAAIRAPTAVSPGMWLRSKVPAPLREAGFILEHWQWIGLFVLILIGVIVDRIVVAVLRAVVYRRLEIKVPGVDQDLVRRSLRPFGMVAMALVWSAGLRVLSLPVEVLLILKVAVRFVAAAAGVLGAYRLVDILSAILERRAARSRTKFDDLLAPLTRKSLKIFIAAFGLVFIADVLDLDIGTLLAGLGLGGLAFALAAQDTVSNLFGSLTVILDRPFAVGDWVVIGDVEGTVEELGFRSTRIRTFYHSLITLPNSNLIKASVDNLGRRRYRRWKTRLRLTLDTPPEKIEALCEGIRELIRLHPYTRKDYYHIYFNEFGDYGFEILVYIFHETPDWGTELRERHRLGVDIVRLAHRLGIAFAVPTQTLYMKRGEAVRPETSAPIRAEAIDQAHESGRAEARAIAKSLLPDDAPPPPVSFE